MNSDASAGRRLTPTTALVAVLAVLAALLGTSVATVSATAGAAVAATSTATPAAASGSLNYGPAPWWQGNCDADHWKSVASKLGWTGVGSHPLGASYLGISVCGPRPFVDGSPDVIWGRSGWGESEWQCVELAQRFMAQVYGTRAFQANGADVVAHYDANLYGGGLVKITNGTTGVAPQPGDIVSMRTTAGPYGHVTVVVRTSIDATGTGTVTMLSQNDSSDGWRTLPIVKWRLGNQGSLVPYGWLHDPLGRGNPLGEGQFVSVRGNPQVYVIVGGAAIKVTNWANYGGAQHITIIDQPQFDSFVAYPTNGTYVQDITTKKVYRTAGGTPLLVSSTDQSKLPLWGTAPVVPLEHRAFVTHDRLRTMPMDHTQICRVDDGTCYVIVGGAPLRVPAANAATTPGWNPTRSILVSGGEFSAWVNMRKVPVNGTFVCDAATAACYRVAGGAPLLMGAKDPAVPGFNASTVVRVPHYEFTSFVHLARTPADGTVLCPTGDRVCYVVAGHAPIAIARSTTPVVPYTAAVVVARTELTHPVHLAAKPVDGTLLRAAQSQAVYAVHAGVAVLQPASTTTTSATNPTPVTIDQTAIDNAGLTGAWSHLASLPPTMSLIAPRVLVTTARTTTVSWKAPVASSAVTTYDVRVQRWNALGASSAWQPLATGIAATSTTATLSNGVTSCFSVRAHNRAGQTGPWSTGACSVRPIDDTRADALTAGKRPWTTATNAAFFGGTALTTSKHGAVWTLSSATFRRIGVLATAMPNGGSVLVLVNGKSIGTVKLANSTVAYKTYIEIPRLVLTTGSISLVVSSPDGHPVQIDGLVLSRA